MDTQGMLNQVTQAFDADESYLVTYFEVYRDSVELEVVVRDGGVPSEPDRFVVTVRKDGELVAEAGPEPTIADALRNAHHKAKSHL